MPGGRSLLLSLLPPARTVYSLVAFGALWRLLPQLVLSASHHQSKRPASCSRSRGEPCSLPLVEAAGDFHAGCGLQRRVVPAEEGVQVLDMGGRREQGSPGGATVASVSQRCPSVVCQLMGSPGGWGPRPMGSQGLWAPGLPPPDAELASCDRGDSGSGPHRKE